MITNQVLCQLSYGGEGAHMIAGTTQQIARRIQRRLLPPPFALP